MEPRHVGRCCICGAGADFLDVTRRGLLCEEHRPKPREKVAEFVRGTFIDKDGHEVLATWLPDDFELTSPPPKRRRRKPEKEPGG